MSNKDLLPVSHYIDKLKAREIYHSDIPSELKNKLEIVHAEVEAGVRIFTKRGYDVIRNRFFVQQTTKCRDYDNEICERNSFSFFESFSAYYEYLKGDIYTESNYYQYQFCKEDIEKYGIRVKRISQKATSDYNLYQLSQIYDNKEKQERAQTEAKKKKLIKWKKKFCACTNIDELDAIVEAFEEKDLYGLEYMLSSFALVDPKQNIPIIIRFLTSKNANRYKRLLTMLCALYGDKSVLNCFDKSNRKIKSEISEVLESLENGDLVRKERRYYDAKSGFYVVIKKISGINDSPIMPEKGSITIYYNDFDSFVKALNNDLSYCDLSDAPISKIKVSKYTMNDKTILPYLSLKSPVYSITKRYDYESDSFIVKESWRASETSPVSKSRTHKFSYFGEVVAFLDGDLSNADLSMCDGLDNMIDFEGIDLTGALLRGTIKKRIGVPFEDDAAQIAAPVELLPADIAETVNNNSEIDSHKRQQDDSLSYTRIHYISDLHLDHRIAHANCLTNEDVKNVIKKSAIDISGKLYSRDTLIIVGDIAGNFEYFKIFIKMLRGSTKANIVLVLGNHDLWGFENKKLSEIISEYKGMLSEEKIVLLQNNIVYLENGGNIVKEITTGELDSSEAPYIRKKLSKASAIIFGGIGFAGLNADFNADNGIYRGAVSREEEIEESIKFEALYTKVRNILPDKELIVATHMPLSDWSRDIECHSGYVYLHGHTHKNEFLDNDIFRIYADNQTGYRRKTDIIKHFYIEGNFDPFCDYSDGIYEISREDYVDFYRGKKIRMTFMRSYDQLYMLKRDGYYCFLLRSVKGQLSILNGGSAKNISSKSIENCYEKMANIIARIKEPLDKFTAFQKQISDFIKEIGGVGRIHGAIIDIDFYNHVYVNPEDLKITSYFALDIVDKLVYGSLKDLLSAQRPDMLPVYKKYLLENASMSLVLSQGSSGLSEATPYYSTDIYQVSNLLKKMQRLYNNILTAWPEDTNFDNDAIMPGKKYREALIQDFKS